MVTAFYSTSLIIIFLLAIPAVILLMVTILKTLKNPTMIDHDNLRIIQEKMKKNEEIIDRIKTKNYGQDLSNEGFLIHILRFLFALFFGLLIMVFACVLSYALYPHDFFNIKFSEMTFGIILQFIVAVLIPFFGLMGASLVYDKTISGEPLG